MKRMLLPILVIGVLLLSACAGQTTAPPAETAPTEQTTPEVETPTPEIRIEKLPYSWTEGVFLITIEEVLKYHEPAWEDYDWYKLRVSFKNTSHMTTKADIHLGDFKLKTEKGNLYDLKYVGCQICNFRFDPEESYHSDSCSFRIQKGEKPTELWLYEFEGYEDVRPVHAETPIILKLETPASETQIEKLPYSWTEGVVLITIAEVTPARVLIREEEWESYDIRITFKNTSHQTTTAWLEVGYLRLRTDKENVYDWEYDGGINVYHTFAPEEAYEPVILPRFRIHIQEKPTELLLYGDEYAEEPIIIFTLET